MQSLSHQKPPELISNPFLKGEHADDTNETGKAGSDDGGRDRGTCGGALGGGTRSTRGARRAGELAAGRRLDGVGHGGERRVGRSDGRGGAGIGGRDGRRGRGDDTGGAGSGTDGLEVGLDLSGQGREPGRQTAGGLGGDDFVGDGNGGRRRVGDGEGHEGAGEDSEEGGSRRSRVDSALVQSGSGAGNGNEGSNGELHCCRFKDVGFSRSE